MRWDSLKVAEVGDTIEFKRESIYAKGQVIQVNENSVIVEVKENLVSVLAIPNNRTVVNHKNYSILKNK